MTRATSSAAPANRPMRTVFLMPCGRFRDRAWCGRIAGSGLAGGQQPEERDRVHPAQGLVGLLKRRKVTVVNGFGTLTLEGAVAVDGPNAER